MSVFVAGTPAPQGSKRVFNGHVVDVNPRALKEWRELVAHEAQRYGVQRIETEPVQITLDFYFSRPKAHFRANGQIKDSAPHYPATRPDIDKLARAVLDALTGVAFRDDAQVARLDVRKRYADNDPTGVRVAWGPAWR